MTLAIYIMLYSFLSLLLVMGGALGAEPAHKPHYPASAHAQLFTEFKTTYSKQYASLREDQLRFMVFKRNLAKIYELNAESEDTVYGINKFADLTAEEFSAQYSGLTVEDRSQVPVPPPLTNMTTAVPATFDWRDKGVVTRVKNEISCAAGWAFPTIGSLESNYARKTGHLKEFSVQQLLDCDKNEMGCLYGWPPLACQYLKESGSMTETDYPYIGVNATCAYKSGKVVTHAIDCTNYAGSSEEDIKKILVNKGPIVIVANLPPLQVYIKGVIDSQCSKKSDWKHGVLLVGYGKDYWIAKNSWNTEWGEEGYFRMKMGVGCLQFNTILVMPVVV